MDVEGIRALVAEEMKLVDGMIREQLRSEVALIDQLGSYLVNSGGKRLRPLLVLLSARACDYPGKRHVDVATIVEFIHTATLLHDDVVDESELRRGRQTANALWGNAASVLVGDFLYSRAFQLMVGVQSMRLMEIMADTTNIIAEGEVMQLLNVHDPETTEERYIRVIHCKTAKLFEASAQLGAVLAGSPGDLERGLARYGKHVGTAFQLIDDVLDYSSAPEETGKNIGDDLAEGKPTLPLIYAMRNGTSEQAITIRNAIEQGGLEQIEQIGSAIESTGALTYTSRLAQEEANLAIAAIEPLPDSPFKEALVGLAMFSANRDH